VTNTAISIAHQGTNKPAFFVRLVVRGTVLAWFCSGTLVIAQNVPDRPGNQPVKVPADTGMVRQAQVDPQTITLPVVDGKGIRFTRLSTDEGLSQTRVIQIVQDNQGFMWFGSQYGINRYDGYKFKVFKHEPGRTNSLSGVFISSLFKDRSGTLWVGCDDFLDKFDPVTENFTHYHIDTGSAPGETVPVTHISQDHAGMLWLSTLRGLLRFNPSTGQTLRYRHDPHNPFSLSSDEVKQTDEDRTGTFWVVTSEGLDAFDRNTGKVTLHIPIQDHREMSFYEDRFGVFWIVHVTGGGVEVYDRKTNTLTHYSFHEGHVSDALPTGVMAMLEDRDGTLWFATLGNGLLKLDRKGQKFIRYRNDPVNPDSLGQDDVAALFQDREGNIWAGLHMMPPTRFATRPPLFEKFRNEPGNPNSMIGTMVNCIYEDRRGILWIGSTDALNRVDRNSGQYTFYRTWGGVRPRPTAIIEDRSGFLWVGTGGLGLIRHDPETGLFKQFRHRPTDPLSLSSDNVTQLLLDHAGRLWATTFDGLNRFDPATSHFSVYKPDPQGPAHIDLGVNEDPQGALWVGTHSSGLERFDPAAGRFTASYRHNPNDSSSLSNNRVNSVYFDRSGAMWVGTQDGLDRFDPGTGGFRTYYEEDGLSGNVVSCILEDERSNLWMSTNNGLSVFDPSRQKFKNYSPADGLPGADLSGWGACSKSSSGEMFFGGFSGGVAFHPDKVADSPYVPPVVLTDFRLFDRPVKVGGDSPLSKSISYTNAIHLPHDKNVFSLEFSALSYFNPATNRYRYKLEGLDREWHEVASSQRLVTYTTLPPRGYTLRVQGATSRGAWSEPGLELAIEILPAWWNRWWFRASSVVTLLALLWVLYRYRLHQIAQEFNVRLEERVNERTRIARELHDTLLQSFHGSLFRFQAARNMLPLRREEAMQALDGALSRAEEAMAEGRDAIQGLRFEPSAHTDVEHLLKSMGQELQSSQDANHNWASFGLTVEGKREALSPIVQDEIYRIARELMRNAFRHADARRIEAEIRYDHAQLRLRVRDDGKGIAPEVLREGSRAGHWGLPGMRERAKRIGARLDIWSQTGTGTEVELTVPALVAYAKVSYASDSDPGRFRLFRRKMGTHVH
jgi:ligand-binding sensor domain-containing protein/signal transduction histidine kinase